MTDMLETEENTGAKRIMGLTFRALCAWILGVLLVACGIGIRVSSMTGHVRLLLVVTLLFTIFTALVFIFSVIGRRPTTVFPAIFFLAFLILWAVVGNKPADIEQLRANYYKRLHAQIGTPFVWGGETNLGIDCSGLARSALWQAMVREGIKEVNPRLLGTRLWYFWWRDVSARDIEEGRYGYTRVLGHADKLAGYDTSELKVGDMAVADKTHLMVYYGKGQWIEASPVDHKVVVNKAPKSSKREWFNEPVTLVRWSVFEKL
jgi:hypothetical protein